MGKAKAAQAFLKTHGFTKSLIRAFGDSVSDMLPFAHEHYAINPGDPLKEKAAKTGYAVISYDQEKRLKIRQPGGKETLEKKVKTPHLTFMMLKRRIGQRK